MNIKKKKKKTGKEAIMGVLVGGMSNAFIRVKGLLMSANKK